jgi:phage terminase large subunit
MQNQPITQAEFDRLLEYYLKHPEEFATDVFGIVPWHVQTEIIKSVFNYKLTAVKTCNAIGKSFIAAVIVVTFLMLFPGSKVVTTAPTWRQVTDVLWSEIATLVKRSKYKLTDSEVTQAGLNIDTDWFAVGLSTKRPENFFGYHADYVLAVVDEAGGVEEPIFKGVAAITPNKNARVLLIGNPTNPGGTFYDAFTKPELGYNRFSVSAFDSPNFTENNIKNVNDLINLFTPPQGITQAEHTAKVQETLKEPYPTLIDPGVVYGRFFEWGADSPAWQSLVMGEFPTQADQALIPTNLVTMAMNMYGKDPSGENYAEISGWNIPDGTPAYGQDMARFGNDSNVCTPRRGGWVEKQVVWNKVDLMESAERILKIIDPLDQTTQVNIDDTGNGGGTTDRLRQKNRESFDSGQPAHQYGISAYNFSSKDFMNDDDKEKYHDITSMLYWNLRLQFFNKAIAMHYDKELFDELVGRRWGITPAGKIKVESKEEYKKRTGGKSPDKSDSLALAFAPRRVGSWKDIPKPDIEPDFQPLTAGFNKTF